MTAVINSQEGMGHLCCAADLYMLSDKVQIEVSKCLEMHLDKKSWWHRMRNSWIRLMFEMTNQLVNYAEHYMLKVKIWM